MTMPDTPIATYLNKTLDIKVNLFSKLTLNLMLPVNNLSETINLFIGKVIHLGIRTDTGLS